MRIDRFVAAVRLFFPPCVLRWLSFLLPGLLHLLDFVGLRGHRFRLFRLLIRRLLRAAVPFLRGIPAALGKCLRQVRLGKALL